MKRKFFIALLLILLINIRVKAETQKDPRVNLIDMSTVEISKYPMPNHSSAMLIKSRVPITVKQNARYTIIVDERYYERDLDRGEFFSWTINDDTVDIDTEHHTSQYGNWVFGSFVAPTNQVILDGIIVNNDLENLEEFPFRMMMFEGNMDDFVGYYGYGSVFDYQQRYLLMDVENMMSLSDVMNMVSTVDPENTDLSLVETNYEANQALGDFHVRLKASDTFLNTAFYQLNIRVVDTTPPRITGQSFYQVSAYHHDLTEHKMRYRLSVVDNVDGVISLGNLEIVENTFSGRYNQPGTHYVVFEATDSSNNKSRFKVTVEVVDDRSPVITGPLYLFRKIQEGIIHDQDLLSLYTAIDEVDGERPITITENNQDGTLGKKSVVLRSVDEAGNERLLTVHIIFIDNTTPVFISDPLILDYQTLQNMTQEDIINWISGHIPNASIEILHNELLYSNQGKIYFAYDLEGVTHYGIIEVTRKNDITPFIIMSSLIIFNAIFLAIYFKKKKY